MNKTITQAIDRYMLSLSDPAVLIDQDAVDKAEKQLADSTSPTERFDARIAIAQSQTPDVQGARTRFVAAFKTYIEERNLSPERATQILDAEGVPSDVIAEVVASGPAPAAPKAPAATAKKKPKKKPKKKTAGKQYTTNASEQIAKALDAMDPGTSFTWRDIAGRDDVSAAQSTIKKQLSDAAKNPDVAVTYADGHPLHGTTTEFVKG